MDVSIVTYSTITVSGHPPSPLFNQSHTPSHYHSSQTFSTNPSSTPSPSSPPPSVSVPSSLLMINFWNILKGAILSSVRAIRLVIIHFILIESG